MAESTPDFYWNSAAISVTLPGMRNKFRDSVRYTWPRIRETQLLGVCGFSWFSFFLSAVEAALHSRTMAAYPFICTPLLDPNRSLSDYFGHEPAVVEQQTGGNIKKFCETNTLVRILVDYKNDPKCANTVAGLGSPSSIFVNRRVGVQTDSRRNRTRRSY